MERPNQAELVEIALRDNPYLIAGGSRVGGAGAGGSFFGVCGSAKAASASGTLLAQAPPAARSEAGAKMAMVASKAREAAVEQLVAAREKKVRDVAAIADETQKITGDSSLMSMMKQWAGTIQAADRAIREAEQRLERVEAWGVVAVRRADNQHIESELKRARERFASAQSLASNPEARAMAAQEELLQGGFQYSELQALYAELHLGGLPPMPKPSTPARAPSPAGTATPAGTTRPAPASKAKGKRTTFFSSSKKSSARDDAWSA